MSSFICNPEHIGALAAIYTQQSVCQDVRSAARILAQQNIKAVLDRYHDKEGENGTTMAQRLKRAAIIATSEAWAAHYQLVGLPDFGMVDVQNLIACYEYQAENSPDWDESVAKKLVQGINPRRFAPRGTVKVKWQWKEETEAVLDSLDLSTPADQT
jgi:hypothetical protein